MSFEDFCNRYGDVCHDIQNMKKLEPECEQEVFANAFRLSEDRDKVYLIVNAAADSYRAKTLIAAIAKDAETVQAI